MDKEGNIQRYSIAFILLVVLLYAGCVADVVEHNTSYLFSFDSASINPLVVPKGGEVTAQWTYTIRNVPRKGINPWEKIAIYKGDKLLAMLQEKPFRVEDGTWQDYLTFELPRMLSVGSYTIVITLTDGHSVYTKKIIFNIR